MDNFKLLYLVNECFLGEEMVDGLFSSWPRLVWDLQPGLPGL